MNSYFVNGKKVNYSIFSAYLRQAVKHIVFKENKFEVNSYEFNKRVQYLYFDYYNDMKTSGLIYELDKIKFSVIN